MPARRRTPRGIESFQTSFKGYRQNFLGNAYQIAMPFVRDAGRVLKRTVLKQKHIADYINYSVVMHHNERLPLYSIANIDRLQRAKRTVSLQGKTRPGSRSWYVDQRVGSKNQSSQAYYTKASKLAKEDPTFKVNKGHLAMRVGVAYTNDYKPGQEAHVEKLQKANKGVRGYSRYKREAKKAQDSAIEASHASCFHTNAVPQHGFVNGDEWGKLEARLIYRMQGKHMRDNKAGKCTSITGPVYTAQDAKIFLDDHDEKGLRIPSYMWKVVSFVKKSDAGDAEQCTYAFLMKQTGRNAAAEGAASQWEDPDAKLVELYQTSTARITMLTGIDFEEALYRTNPYPYYQNPNDKIEEKDWDFTGDLEFNNIVKENADGASAMDISEEKAVDDTIPENVRPFRVAETLRRLGVFRSPMPDPDAIDESEVLRLG
jgi:DNA/RNA endonuclease G (NUC1)